ncbi:hypothetical protein ACFPTR_09950 [Aliibacillus thermotolerans]|uniref:Uncharacterized protein n=1 Tax=Aliibacillus thermotolerans TaxID=1834418 RepID=A0ABW0UA46_9BACI|nr:hypothetical protein [Aliibacillus thermotolerans]
MLIAMGDVLIIGMVIGGLSVYSFFEQRRLFFSISILLLLCMFVGVLLTNLSWFVVDNTVAIAWIRVIMAGVFIAFAFYCYTPLQGYFHRDSHSLWLGLSFIFLFIGWHVGQVTQSIVGFISYFIVFLLSFVIGNMVQGQLERTVRKYRFLSFLPFITLLFFSVLFLL